jgi:hypothetical protein
MMAVETEITILVNRKSDIDLIKEKIIDSKIQFPVYIFEYENHYRLNFTSDYAEWELDSVILECFPEYELTTDLNRGRKEIRLQIYRYQSELSTDDWGRPIENPLDETKYLVKKSNSKPEKFNPKVNVLFGADEQQYYINIVGGINKATGEKGFLLLDEFKNNVTNETEILKDKLYKTPHEAFDSGYYKIQELVDNDFKEYIEKKKKELRDIQKIPRKIVRDFINSCNKSENEGIFKDLDENVIYEKRTDWQTELKIEGKEELKKNIESLSQELCGKDFKIRSSWDIKLPVITIGVKYFPTTNDDNEIGNIQQYIWIRFLLENSKIINIIVGNRHFL